MNAITKQEQTARATLRGLPIADLLTQWELTTTLKKPHVYTVRGWLMDEIESRNPEGFDLWLCGEARDETLRGFILSA